MKRLYKPSSKSLHCRAEGSPPWCMLHSLITVFLLKSIFFLKSHSWKPRTGRGRVLSPLQARGWKARWKRSRVTVTLGNILLLSQFLLGKPYGAARGKGAALHQRKSWKQPHWADPAQPAHFIDEAAEVWVDILPKGRWFVMDLLSPCTCVCVRVLSCAQLFASTWAVARHARLSMGRFLEEVYSFKGDSRKQRQFPFFPQPWRQDVTPGTAAAMLLSEKVATRRLWECQSRKMERTHEIEMVNSPNSFDFLPRHQGNHSW